MFREAFPAYFAYVEPNLVYPAKVTKCSKGNHWFHHCIIHHLQIRNSATIPLIQFSALTTASFFYTKNADFTHIVLLLQYWWWYRFLRCIWITFPPGPITAPINSLSINIFNPLGACGFTSALASGIAFIYMWFKICSLPSFCLPIMLFSSPPSGRPSNLYIHLYTANTIAGYLLLKSISPRWSSSRQDIA